MLTLIPIFEKFIYPGLKKLGVPQKPLQRMGAGLSTSRNCDNQIAMINATDYCLPLLLSLLNAFILLSNILWGLGMVFCAAAFVVSAVLQQKIDSAYQIPKASGALSLVGCHCKQLD